MKAKEFRLLKTEELRSKIEEMQEEAFWLKFKLKSGQLDKSSTIRDNKRNLARALTILGERVATSEDSKR